MGAGSPPENLLPVAGAGEAPDSRFAELRERVLLDYGRNTARAYWGDLDDAFWWARRGGKDVLRLCGAAVRLLARGPFRDTCVFAAGGAGEAI